MTGSKISYNIHAQMVKDSSRLKQHLLKIQPAAVLVLDGLGLAQEIKAALPNTLVIHRNYGITNGDDDVHKRITPERWLELRAKEADGGMWLYTTNEPGFTKEAIDWNVHLMELCVARQIHLVIGNFGVGQPGGVDDWGQAQRMLELLDQHRDLFILGLHEYACGIITSGLYGGYPDHAGVDPNGPDKDKGLNLIPPEAWPPDIGTFGEPGSITAFHMGRFRFLVKYCKDHGLNPPRIILTEHGMDDVSDIKFWAEKLPRTSPYLSIRGWKSLLTVWGGWFKRLNWSMERAYFEQLIWADKTIYRNSPVEAQLVYCWAHSSQDWEQFDVAEASEFQSLLESHAATPAAPSQPALVSEPPPAPSPVFFPSKTLDFPPDFDARAIRATIHNTGVVNLREKPDIESGVVYRIQPKDYIVRVIREDGLTPAEENKLAATIAQKDGYWLPIALDGLSVRGWVFSAILNWQITSDGRLQRLQALQMQVGNVQTLLTSIEQNIQELIANESNQ